jgi:hypothetical protein
MTNLPLETPPDPALEERVVSTLIATGLVRRRRAFPVWLIAAAAVIVLVVGVTMLRRAPSPAPGNTYVVLLYEDSTYRPALPGHDAERVAVLARWADSLDTKGEFERAGRLRGPGPLGGLFMVRAADDAEAERIAASCPFTKWGGHIEVKRFDP